MIAEEWRADESEDYSRLVAEVYSCLLVPRAPKDSDGGGLSSESGTNDQQETSRIEALLSHTNTEPSPAAPSWMLSLPVCYPRATERSQLLLAVAQLIDDTAEEVSCEMLAEPSHPAHKNRHLQGKFIDNSHVLWDFRDPPSSSSSGWCYHDALERMTIGLWELASGASMLTDPIEKEDRSALLCIEKAARLVQEWLRRQWARRRTRMIQS